MDTFSKAAVASEDSRTFDKETVKDRVSESVGVRSVGIENNIIEDERERILANGVYVGGRIMLNVWRLM